MPLIYNVKSNPYSYTLKEASGTAIDETSWHTYGFTYDESGMSFYVDNVLQQTLSSPALSASYRTDCMASSLVSTNPNAGNCPPIQDFAQVWLSCLQLGQTVGTTPTNIQFRNFKYYQKDYYVDNDTTGSNFGPSDGTYSETGTWTTSSLINRRNNIQHHREARQQFLSQKSPGEARNEGVQFFGSSPLFVLSLQPVLVDKNGRATVILQDVFYEGFS